MYSIKTNLHKKTQIMVSDFYTINCDNENNKLFALIRFYFALIFLLFSASIFAQNKTAEPYLPVPEHLLHKHWTNDQIELQSKPKTPTSDSFYIKRRGWYYYDSDSLYKLIATQPIYNDSLYNEIWYYQNVMTWGYNKRETVKKERAKLVAAIEKYKSPILERRLAVFDFSTKETLGKENKLSRSYITENDWNSAWDLAMEWDKLGDYRSKFSLLRTMLAKSSGFPTWFIGDNMRRVPFFKLQEELFKTIDICRKKGIYLPDAAETYMYYAIIYYDYHIYDKAKEMCYKALETPATYKYDRSKMRARDYLGAIAAKEKKYALSDSFYIEILKDPDTAYFLRPLDNVVAFSALASNAKAQGYTDEAFRI
jgi:hypothetical protein